MQTRRLVIALLLLSALGGYVWWSETRPESDEPELEEYEEELLPGADVEAVTRLTIGPPGKDVTLRRVGEDDWVVAGDSERAADDALAESAARAAIGVISTRRIEAVDVSAEALGLGEGALRVTVELDGHDGPFSYRLGGTPPVGNGRYLSVEGEDRVHLVGAYSLSPLERDPLDYRDRRLLPIDPDVVSSITVTWADGRSAALQRRDRLWFLAGTPAWRVESSRARDLLVELVDLRAESFLTGTGSVLSEPDDDVTIELGGPDGATATLRLSPLGSGGLRRASVEGYLLPAVAQSQAASVRADFLPDLDADPESWRAMELLDFNPWVITEVEWASGGETWNLTKDEDGDWRRGGPDGTPLDADKVFEFLADLDDLTAAAYAPEDLDPADAGVEAARIELSQPDGAPVGLSLRRGANRDYVEVIGEPGLREVGADVFDAMGHLRPLQADPAASDDTP